MNTLWIGDGKPPSGTKGRSFRQTPSLSEIALQQLEHKTFDAVVLDCRDRCPYSAPHILSASALFCAASVRFCVLGGCMGPLTDAWMIRCDGSAELALEKLGKTKGPRKQQSTEAVRQKRKASVLAPLQRPVGTFLTIDVLGSQARIGCTTQCLQLFHYFSALGFQPAVVATPDQVSTLQRLMGGTQADDALLIDDVAFVTSAQSRYDCYIRDVGCIDGAKAFAAQNADYCVLVAGIKPWEVSAAVTALTSLHDVRRLLTVASYGDEESKKQIQALMQKTGRSGVAITAPWQPNPFIPTSLGCYEAIRPILETMMKEEIICE